MIATEQQPAQQPRGVRVIESGGGLEDGCVVVAAAVEAFRGEVKTIHGERVSFERIEKQNISKIFCKKLKKRDKSQKNIPDNNKIKIYL